MTDAKLAYVKIPYKYIHDVVAFARDLLGIEPDAAQAELLSAKQRQVILNCRRQWGKSTMAAIFAVHRAVKKPDQKIVVVSPTMRQSRELAAKCLALARKLKLRLKTDGTNPRSIVFPNGSVILPLPANADSVRGFTAHLLIIDEAARVKDEVIAAATPMLTTTDGDLWLLSTPNRKRGIFYEVWADNDASWTRIEGKASSGTGAKIAAGFLVRERKWKRAEEYQAEHECEFTTPDRNVFPDAWIDRAFRADIPIFDELARTDLQFVRHRPAYYLSLDLGYSRDHAALVLLEYRPTPTGTQDAATRQHLYRRDLRVVHIEQFRLRTGVQDLLRRVRKLCEHPHLAHNTQLILDATSQPMIAREFREAKLPVSLLPISITGGEKESVTAGQWSVPKKVLVGCLELVLEKDIVHVAAALGQADVMKNELRQFERVSQRGGAIKYGAGSGHDDLVMALAMAVWWAWTNRRHLLSGPEAKPLD